MAGRIHFLVAGPVLDGLARAAPDAVAGEDVAALVAEGRESGSVALGPYRRLLSDVRRRAGAEPLLRAGEALRHARDPLLFVLLNAGDPVRLIEEEARLARFVHSRHRVRLEGAGAGWMRLRHAALRGRPTPEEHLVNCGIHAVLLREIGCEGLRVRLPDAGDPGRWVVDRDDVRAPAEPGSFACWHVEWDEFAPTRRPLPGLDAILLRAAAPDELPDEAGWADRARALLSSDLTRTWRIDDVADELGFPRRSLQRALSREGTTYRKLLDEVRVSEAARLLDESDLSVTAIGYACGFADTSHFTRAFKRRHAHPPSRHRTH